MSTYKAPLEDLRFALHDVLGAEALFARLPAPRLRMVDEILAECQESLVYMANPTIVLEWLATRLYLLLPR